jgi:hypothetical protein
MNGKFLPIVSAIAFGLAAHAACAQSTGGASGMSGMPGMAGMPSKSPGGEMKGMDMDAMMKQCSQMRAQMKPGDAMSPDMKKKMSDCDAMDRSMTAPAQPYVPPAERTR